MAQADCTYQRGYVNQKCMFVDFPHEYTGPPPLIKLSINTVHPYMNCIDYLPVDIKMAILVNIEIFSDHVQVIQSLCTQTII